jgi:hypothetical protein
VHAALDTPAGELTAAPRPQRGPGRALLVAAAVIAIAAIVGTTLVTRDEGAGPASDVSTFCAQVERLVSTPVDRVNGEPQGDEPSLEFLRDAPEEIRPAALDILAANKGSRSPEVSSSQQFLRWWQLRCYPDAAQPGAGTRNERFAPLPTPAPLELCGASSYPMIRSSQQGAELFGTITVYGDADTPDPYTGRMIGLVRSNEQRFYRDDHAEPIAVAGHPDAELIDAAGLYGAPIDGLGIAITWEDGDGHVALIARGATRDDAPDLAELAERVTVGSEGTTLTDAGRDGLTALYTGPVGEVYANNPSSYAATTFNVAYDTSTGVGGVNLYGSVPGPGGLDALRFFAPELRPETVGDTRVLAGDLAVTNGPEGSVMRVAAWEEGDVLLTLRSNGGDFPSAATVDAFVAATRRLDRSEWAQLVAGATACTWSESSSGSGSSSDSTSKSSSDSTSTTTFAVPPAAP